MTLGTENKKQVVFLGVLAVVILVALYMDFAGDSSTPPQVFPRPVVGTGVPNTGAPNTAAFPSATGASGPVARNAGRASTEFRPRIPGSRPEDTKDPSSIDPELRLDLLAKVQAVEPVAAGRNLFQFGTAPPPPTPIPAVPTGVPKIPVNQQPQPVQARPITPAGPPPPPPAPINLKYYGYAISKLDGHKQAFLLDGEDIMLVTENQTVKQRYRIVRIALTSIDIEDTQSKNTQTLKLQDIPS